MFAFVRAHAEQLVQRGARILLLRLVELRILSFSLVRLHLTLQYDPLQCGQVYRFFEQHLGAQTLRVRLEIRSAEGCEEYVARLFQLDLVVVILFAEALNPLKHLNPVHLRHLEVQQHHRYGFNILYIV